MVKTQTSTHYLVISALGKNCSTLVNELMRSCSQCGCNILNSRVLTLGNESAITLLLSGTWSAIAKMEAVLPTLEEQLGISTLSQRTFERENQERLMPYTIDIVSLDKPGILYTLTQFLTHQGVSIEEISTHCYLTQTHARMANIALKVHLGEHLHIAALREQFLSYCESHNLDATMEPIRV